MKRSKSKRLNLRILDVEEMTPREMASVTGGGWWADMCAGFSDMWEVMTDQPSCGEVISEAVGEFVASKDLSYSSIYSAWNQ